MTFVMLLVLVVYFALYVWFGRAGYRMSRTLADYVAGSWDIPLIILLGTFTATWVSAVSVIGFPGMTYKLGLVSLTGIYAGYFMANSLMPIIAYKLRRPEKPPATVPEFLRLRFEPHVSRSGLQAIGALVMVVGYFLYVMLQAKAIAILLSTITGLPYILCLAVVAAFVIYVAAGGTFSVAVSDLYNTVVIVLGVVLCAAFVLPQAGGWSNMWSQFATISTPPMVGAAATKAGSLVSFLGPFSVSYVVGLFISSAFGGSVAPHWPSRMLYARNVKTAIWVPLASQIPILVIYAALLICGVAGRVLVPTMPPGKDTDWIMPLLFTQFVPSLIGAIGIAALLAAAISTINSMILHGGLALSYDLIRNLSPKKIPDEKLVRISRLLVIAVGLVATVLAIKPPALIAIMSAYVFGWWGACFIVPLYVGLYWKRLNRQAVYWAAISGPIVYSITNWLITKKMMSDLIPSIIWGILVALVGAVICSFVFKPAPREAWEPFEVADVSEETKKVWLKARGELA
jgi:sodium/pantothenate symporter